MKRITQIGDIIAVACERRVEMIISILAILKAGAAYLPIRINDPSEVNHEIVKTANPKFILASELGSKNIKDKGRIISLEEILKNPYSSHTRNPNTSVGANDLAYVIFTSGSTGVPKGVTIKTSISH